MRLSSGGERGAAQSAQQPSVAHGIAGIALGSYALMQRPRILERHSICSSVCIRP